MGNFSYFDKVDDPEIAFYIHHLRLDNFETSFHSHQKSQLLYAEGGIVHVLIDDYSWYLPARCYMWIPANTQHAVLSYSKNIDLYNLYFTVDDDENPIYKHTCICFAVDLLREMFVNTKKWKGPIDAKQEAPYFLLQTIKVMLPELQANKIPFAIQHPFPKDEKLIEIGNFLLENLDKEYTFEDIAKIFRVSTRTLSRTFKEDIGMNYIRFRRSLRINKALELIAENKYNMLQIALIVGYSSVSSFSKIFLKITGMRPTDYVKLLRN